MYQNKIGLVVYRLLVMDNSAEQVAVTNSSLLRAMDIHISVGFHMHVVPLGSCTTAPRYTAPSKQ